MQLIHIATSRAIGKKCVKWAKKNLPEGYRWTDDPEKADYFFSVLYEHLVSEVYIMGRRGCYNFHPGVLPYYKGAGAYSWVIINKEKETGVTLHEIDPDIDNGPVIEIAKFPIEGWDTSETLFRKAEEAIYSLFTKWFKRLLVGDYEAKEQTEKGAIYYRKDLNKAKDLTRYVRAFTFKGKDNCFFRNKYGQRVELKYEDRISS
jgi:methionyl-tRNA formyltransferase